MFSSAAPRSVNGSLQAGTLPITPITDGDGRLELDAVSLPGPGFHAGARKMDREVQSMIERHVLTFFKKRRF